MSRAVEKHRSESDGRYRIAVIPGDGIGQEVVPEGLRVLEPAARQYGFTLQRDDFETQQDFSGQLEGFDRGPRRDLLRCSRLGGKGTRSHLALGVLDTVPSRIRSIGKSASGAAHARHALSARRTKTR